MITILEAYNRIANNTFPLSSESRDVKEAVSFYLSEDVFAPISMPPFRQSAMDGYAVHSHQQKEYKLIGKIRAGDNLQIQLKPGESLRIFTGAAVPDSADAVVIQEKVVEKGNLIVTEDKISKNQNIRSVGEQVKENALALPKGTRLTPAAIGFLSSLGITEVNVTKKPSIAIVSTGNELIEPGKPLGYRKIYESNSTMLASALKTLHFNEVKIYTAKDDYQATLELLNNLLDKYDLILFTGGISVGDYDFVGKALNQLKVEELFYKVNQKPGKPLYFGKKNNTTVFALPGNPAAALSCFYIYVRLCLELLSGNNKYHLTKVKAASASEFIKKGDKPQFLKANLDGNTVEILDGQSSAMLQTFALANGLVYVPEEVQTINLGDIVEVIPLPISI